MWVRVLILTDGADTDVEGTVSLSPFSAGFSIVYSCLLVDHKMLFPVEHWGSDIVIISALNLGFSTYRDLLVKNYIYVVFQCYFVGCYFAGPLKVVFLWENNSHVVSITSGWKFRTQNWGYFLCE